MHDVTSQFFDKRVTVMNDHQGLGSGTVDVDAVIRMLCDARFDGPVVLEVHTVDPIDSVRVLRAAIDRSAASLFPTWSAMSWPGPNPATSG